MKASDTFPLQLRWHEERVDCTQQLWRMKPGWFELVHHTGGSTPGIHTAWCLHQCLRWPRRDYKTHSPEEGCLCVAKCHTHTHTFKHQNTNIQKYKYTKIQIYKNTDIQKYRNTNIQKYIYTNIQKFKTQTLHLHGFMACSKLLNCLTPPPCPLPPHPTPPRRLKGWL